MCVCGWGVQLTFLVYCYCFVTHLFTDIYTDCSSVDLTE